MNHWRRSTLVAFLVVVASGAWACNLPIDPKVCVIPMDATELGAVVSDSECRVTIAADEGQDVNFQAYIDITGRENGLPVTKVWRGRRLIDLATMQAAAALKLKFGELMTRNGFALSDPEAIGMGGTIKGLTITGSVDGASRLADDFGPEAVTDITSRLPHAGGPQVVAGTGPGRKRWYAQNGTYNTDGSFGLNSISSTFEWDKTSIGACTGSGGGPSGAAGGVFEVPTNPYYYENVAFVDMTFNVSNIQWSWQEVCEIRNASDTDWDPAGHTNFTITINGSLTRTSLGGDGTGGHPGYFYVTTKDKTPAVYAAMTGTLPAPTGDAGKVLSGGFPIEFELVDNNPLQLGMTTPDIPVDFYYSLCVTDYLPVASPLPGLGFAEYKDKFVWKKLSGTANRTSVQAYGGGAPVALVTTDIPGGLGKTVNGPLEFSVSKYNVNFNIPLRMGLHFCKDSVDCSGSNGGHLFGWDGGKRLKYFIVPLKDGSDNAGITLTPLPLDAKHDAAEQDGYDLTKDLFPAVVKNTPPEDFEGVVTGPDADKAKGIGNCGKFGDITDKQRPNVFLAVYDTRLTKAHVWGDNTSTLDSDQFAVGGAKTSNEHLRDENTAEFNFPGEATDYGTYQGMYPGPASFHGAPADTNGLWVDEDSRLQFVAWGYDNINTYNNQHGCDVTYDSSTVSQIPSWWTHTQHFGTFKVDDDPGNFHSGSCWPEFIFRDPNRPVSLGSGNCSFEVQAADKIGLTRKVKVNAYVWWNKKDIRGLEEKKFRGN